MSGATAGIVHVLIYAFAVSRLGSAVVCGSGSDDGNCKALHADQVIDAKVSLSMLQHGHTDRKSDDAQNEVEAQATIEKGEATAKIISIRSSVEVNSSQIPVPGFLCPQVRPLTERDGFSLAEYARASWYVQQQQTLAYQRKDSLSCVVATYDDIGSVALKPFKIPFYWGQAVEVYNSCETCRPTLVDGKPESVLCAAVPNERKAALRVLPCFLPEFLGGNYWVLAVGANDKGEYEWAIVSGGQPKVWYPDGCTTYSGMFAYFDAGLWLFSRTKNLGKAQTNEAIRKMKELGFTTKELLAVKQGKGCSYDGAYIKE